MEGEDVMNTRPVFKTKQGWVRQFDDGTIVGPFGSKVEAIQVERTSPKKESKIESEINGIDEPFSKKGK